MILRRLAKSLRSQDWGTVVLEVVIVVLGVFIGIEVSNWNEDRQKRALAQSYVERLATDLSAELTTWEDALQYFQTTHGHARSALEAYNAPAEDLDPQFLIDLYQASQERHLSIRRSTYDELVATGGIEYLRDQALRDALGIHYDLSARRQSVLEDITDYRPVLRRHMDHRVQAAIVEACGETYLRDDFGYQGLRLPESCEIDLPETLVRQEVRRLHDNQVVQQHLRYQASNLTSRIIALEYAVIGARNTRDAVRELER